jgi:flagellar L-ring protein precursor FlgH
MKFRFSSPPIAVLLVLIFALSGCASLKTWLGLNEDKHPQITDSDGLLKYSDNNNVPTTSARDYKKMTRQRMEEESQINAQAGSTWVMEGQGAYLFAQNKTRRQGDLLNVKIEGPALQQVDTKVSVIKKLLKQLEDEEKKAQESSLATPGLAQSGAADGASRAPASAPAAADTDKKDKDDGVKVDNVPTRIVEKQPDGNYRIKGQQPFMIGKREYKVIVTGIIRPEDFNDEGISSNKLLDPQYDVVSLRRKDL